MIIQAEKTGKTKAELKNLLNYNNTDLTIKKVQEIAKILSVPTVEVYKAILNNEIEII